MHIKLSIRFAEEGQEGPEAQGVGQGEGGQVERRAETAGEE